MSNDEIQKTTVINIQDEEQQNSADTGKKKKKKKKKEPKKLSKAGVMIFRLILIASIAVAVVSGWNLYTGFKNYRESEVAYEKLAATHTIPDEPVAAVDENGVEYEYDPVDFDALLEVNPDTVAWIYMEDSVINYPVVQGTDNEYYLHYLFTGEYNNTGTVFMDFRNNADFSDRNTVFYAHHMRNGSMFNTIYKYRDQEFYDEHKTLVIQTPDGAYLAEPFAGLETDGYVDYVRIDFSSDSDYMMYITDLRAQSTFTSDIEIDSEDQILTLSTCAYMLTNGRFALFCKLTPIINTTD